MNRMIASGVMLTALFTHTAAFGTGMLIPKDASVPPLAIKHQRVDIRIKDGTASTSVEQVFQNSVNRDLEAVYVFPLPEDASISDFAMYINGKRVSGELVEKDKARQIYQDIVRRLKDPGLLEHIGGNLFRVSVYPVPKNGEQKIEISYSQALEFDAGLYKYVYPLKTSETASRTMEDFTVRATLSSSVPLKNIYSPSHKTGITRKGDREAVIGLEEEQALLDRDFVLYYGVSEKEFGLNLLTHAVKGEDGYFMMLLSPAVAPEKGKIIQRDVVFVLDSSGSMAGEKIKQAREALKYCVNRLNDGDRFNIVRFSTDVETLNKELLEADAKNREQALKFIEGIEARGGTDIDGALREALGMKHDKDRPCVVVFLTDGKPTIGETDSETILANVKKTIPERTRVFVFGVGADLNTHLLDRVSGDNGGFSQYVEPQEDIEVRVSSFADKISQPALSQPKLSFDKLTTKMIHPQTLPDLFCGNQITVFGRYQGRGDFAIRLSGEVNGEKREFVYEGTFPKKNADNEFIPRLWATRRVGHLLDQIRLHGEEQELKDEIIRLGNEYGIMTPYTSYLVLENDEAYSKQGISRRQVSSPEKPARAADVDAARIWSRNDESGGAPRAAGAAVPMFSRSEVAAIGGQTIAKSATVSAEQPSLRQYFGKEDGKEAVRLSETIQRYRTVDAPEEKMAPAVRHVGRKIFYLTDEVWTDRDYRENMKTIKVKYAGEEYFKLLDEKPELKKYFALGQKVIVCLDDATAVIVE